MFFIRRGIEAVITGLTRNQFVPKAHEGSNPSLCAKEKSLENADFISVFKAFCVIEVLQICAKKYIKIHFNCSQTVVKL